MSIPPSSPGRGCASNFAQPVTPQDRQEAQVLVNNVHHANCEEGGHLAGIVYRIGDFDSDVTRHLFRWDMRPYQEVFEQGFQAIPAPDTDPVTRYDLNDYVHAAGAPLDTSRPRRHVFVSTTLNTDWRPIPNVDTLPGGGQIQVYRYEIYAPGGIWVAATLGGLYQYPSQDEVCFIAGIVPQYIRSAQLFTITRDAYDPGTQPPRPRHQRVDTTLIINRHFNPLSDPTMDLLIIQTPVHYYVDENDRSHRMLRHETYPPDQDGRRRRQAWNGDSEAALKWYGNDVADVSSYINAAFRSSRTNEAFIFMKNEYVLLNYAPHSTDDWIVNGPLLICDEFPSLIATPFGEHGIDCAFEIDTDHTMAFIFSTNLCAYIDYSPADKILTDPMTITSMFPFFEGTVFENGIDSAFRSTKSEEVYLFRGDKCALINYSSRSLIHIKNISDEFHSLLGTVFASGIDAAFASHEKDEAYIFKGEYYALINFAPHTTDDYIIDGIVKPILPNNWPSLASILPHKNGGLDVHNHQYHAHDDDHEHGDL